MGRSDVDLAGAGYQASSREQAESMARVVERWLGNPVVRRALKFVAKRDGDGRRAERLLRSYAGEDVDLSMGDRVAALAVRAVLGYVVRSSELTREELEGGLSTGYWRKGLASVLKGIAWRGPKKPFTAYAPFLVVWNFTNACNLSCEHCYQNADKPTPDELSTQEAIEAVDRMADAGVAYVAISGGEPLARPDVLEVAEAIRERDMAFSVATNGTMLDDETVEALDALDCEYLQVSLDGAKPETHDRFRGRKAFQRTVEGIERASDYDMFLGVSTTVTRHNLEEVPDVIALSEDLGADIWMHYNFIPTGRGVDISEKDLTPEERERLLTYMAEKSQKGGISMLSTAPQFSAVCNSEKFGLASLTHYDTFGQDESYPDLDFLAEFVGGCGTGRLYCALQPNGDISPCVFIPIRSGNILEDDLVEIWHENPEFGTLREREEFSGPCSSCKFTTICGGCRARAYGYLGDLAESDPGCVYNEELWREVVARADVEDEEVLDREGPSLVTG